MNTKVSSKSGSKLAWFWALGLAVVLLPGFLALEQVWQSVTYYSYGYFVPLVALWAAREDRERLRGLPSEREPRGYGVILGALLLYGLGLLLGSASLQGLAIVGVVAGWVLCFFGRAWFRALAFPVGFLLFMVPLPETWIQPVIGELRLFVSRVGVDLLQEFGMAVLRQGNVITIPGGEQLGVEDACSGITSLITLTPLAVFLAYFTGRTWLGRGLIVLSVVPVALGGNLLRVLLTVVGARQWGVEQVTEALVHEATGILTYIVACLVLLAIAALVRRFVPAERLASERAQASA